jgi:hypothetical protein
MPRPSDVVIMCTPDPAVYLVRVETSAALIWVRAHVETRPDLWWGVRTFRCESKYSPALCMALVDAGFIVEVLTIRDSTVST